jgi:SOS-response transcriptional repressor LexA
MNALSTQERCNTMEPLGTQIRRQRRQLGLTLDELSKRAGISKPYLSLIETGKAVNPPSDDKLRRLEQTLGFRVDELLTQAHLQRTPKDVRAVLQKLMPDDSSVLHKMLDRATGEPEYLTANAVPMINRIATDAPHNPTGEPPARGAEGYLTCPDVSDPEAFAARVHGDSMTPKYRQGDIVIFSPALAPRDGDDCFIRFTDGQTTFKRLFFETGDDKRPMLRLQPRNERHRPQTVPSERVTGLYKAVFRYQRVDAPAARE